MNFEGSLEGIDGWGEVELRGCSRDKKESGEGRTFLVLRSESEVESLTIAEGDS